MVRNSASGSTHAVLFDLDGTFADTAPDLATALNHARTLRDLPPLPLEQLRPHASNGSRAMIKAGFNIEPDHPDFIPVRDLFLDYYASNICVETRLFDDMAILIDMLDKHGIRWGIVTNKPHRYTIPLMQALGYAERAACLVSGDTCTRAKPYPDPMFKACELIGVTPEQSLFLGDDLRDMQAANASGMRGIIANYGYVSADASADSWNAYGSIDKPTELLDYLGL